MHNEPDTKPAGEAAKENSIDWHLAFLEAIRLELEQYKDILEFDPEHQLTSEPLRIDVLIIKKLPNTVIKKNIAEIFRTVNIVEYKSPTDYVSVEDFYKVYAYACLYIVTKKVPVTDLTLTFIESRYPRSLLAHLEKVRNFRIEENSPGIYTVTGDILPIQIIDSRKLLPDENIWLKDLSNKLDLPEMQRIGGLIGRQGKAAHIRAYVEAIFKANSEVLKEAFKMSDAAMSLERVLEEAGLIAKWEARGKREGKLEVAHALKDSGLPVTQIVQFTGLSEEQIREL
jgi:predicted transposase/invertase (TIGR01784 family)